MPITSCCALYCCSISSKWSAIKSGRAAPRHAYPCGVALRKTADLGSARIGVTSSPLPWRNSIATKRVRSA
jgi:hypothetical protein